MEMKGCTIKEFVEKNGDMRFRRRLHGLQPEEIKEQMVQGSEKLMRMAAEFTKKIKTGPARLTAGNAAAAARLGISPPRPVAAAASPSPAPGRPPPGPPPVGRLPSLLAGRRSQPPVRLRAARLPGRRPPPGRLPSAASVACSPAAAPAARPPGRPSASRPPGRPSASRPPVPIDLEIDLISCSARNSARLLIGSAPDRLDLSFGSARLGSEDKDAAKSATDTALADYDRKVEEYSTAVATYRLDLTDYTQWIDDDARAAAVLTSSVLPQYAAEFMSLPTAAARWAFLRQRYQPSGDALYLSVVRQEHDLQQGDSTIDEFYTQSAAIWRQLDSLRTAVCGTCPCCLTVRADLEFQRVFEFLSRLRTEFEPRRAQLLARGRVPLSEVLAELRAEETRLRGAGLLAVPSALAARGPPVPSARGSPVPSASLRSPAPPLLSTPPVQGQSQSQQPRGPRPPCAFCGKAGHDVSGCWRRDPSLRQQYLDKLARRQAGSSGSSAVALSDQDIIRGLRGLLAATGSSSTGTAGSVSGSSGTARPPPSTQSGPPYTGPGWSWPSQP
ncbi:uncharacterized protein [Lolium perenne]|uniref:uncharacterized protein n=1 Tax=Lolium perenne TaxID=4522 RepID=UPI003A98CE97